MTSEGQSYLPSPPSVAPKRIQRQRAKGWRMPPDATYVGRPSRWGNRWPVGRSTWKVDGRVTTYNLDAAASVTIYGAWLARELAADPTFLAALRGRDLACWCPLDQPCHADVLLELANPSPPSVARRTE